MRNDLQSMSHGRACPQANHAASVFEYDLGKSSGYKENVSEWKNQTNQGFGTCIVLAASLEQIDKLFNDDLNGWGGKNKVVDPDYVIRVTHEVASFIKGVKFLPDTADENTIAFTRPEVTCAYVFGPKEELDPYLKDLPLY